ncbi:MAG: sigma-70 family RNA polymerase sigma factor [Candidatus Pseudobacter hemicellulosilyticus]|uniref:RNA polymerase sigma factor n=1 Tax=Candidatus Pseudobacter hemicellulosilyticus TaxID=3121375 RepID=A0AAJ6BF23_9BACT|nr:MAG: sigma-70 family RNA polymerase sigma factor [Pseudobacter sp.]
MSFHPTYEEKELLLRIAGGDEQAFGWLHAKYWNEFYSLGIAFLKSAEWAEDVVQEVFIKIWQKRALLPAVEKLEPYLFVVLRNSLISALRTYKRQERDIADYLRAAGQDADNRGLALEVSDTRQLIKEALELLSPQQQLIFRLSREEGLPHQEIADRVGLSPKTVSNTITISLSHIRQYLYRKGNHLLSILLLLTAWMRA